MTDAELVCLARTGQRSAGEQLARRWSARVLALCCARTGSFVSAEDLAQEVLIRGLQGLGGLEDPAKFGPWLRGIATRVCSDWLRSRRQREVPFSRLSNEPCDPPDDAGSPAERLEADDTRRRLLSEIHALPDELRDVIWLHYFDDLTYDQAADLLGVCRATVNSRLAKARDLLARKLSELVR
jgi:RNA polymerase sigma factor (sigma-70 family)